MKKSSGRCRALRLIFLRLGSGDQIIKYRLQIGGQRALEFHAPAVAGVLERKLRGMQKRTIEFPDRPYVRLHPAMDAAIEGVADDGVTNRAEVNPDLVRAS